MLARLLSLFTNNVEVTVSPTTVELRCGESFITLPAQLHVALGSEPPRLVGVGDRVQANEPCRAIELFGADDGAVPMWSREHRLALFFRVALKLLAGAGPFVVRPRVQVRGVSCVAGVLGAAPQAVVKSAMLQAGAWVCEVVD